MPEARGPTKIQDGRFARQEKITGWSQRRLAKSRILVAGAGALGNEVLKNLALLGVGTIGIIDSDVVEESNLSRCVLFGMNDIGRPKAVVAAEGLSALNPNTRTLHFVCNLQHGIGAGLLEEFDLVLGCLDNIAARWKLNRLSRRASVCWIDAGIDEFCGQVTRFEPRDGACYECTMTDSMWQRMMERNSCLLPGEEIPNHPVAATVLITSLTAAFQVQEALVSLFQKEQSASWPGLAPGERLSVRVAPYEMLILKSRVREECMAHGEPEGSPMISRADRASMTVEQLLRECHASALELEWELADGLECSLCGVERIVAPSWRLTTGMLRCRVCGSQRRPHWVHTISLGDLSAKSTLKAVGVPENAHVKVRSSGSTKIIWCRIKETSAKTVGGH